METALLELFVKTGSMTIIVAFFLWRDYRREASFNTQVAELWKYIQNTLEDLTREVTTAVNNNTHVLEVLKVRPCIADAKK